MVVKIEFKKAQRSEASSKHFNSVSRWLQPTMSLEVVAKPTLLVAPGLNIPMWPKRRIRWLNIASGICTPISTGFLVERADERTRCPTKYAAGDDLRRESGDYRVRISGRRCRRNAGLGPPGANSPAMIDN